jgi:hypothetical protein
MLVKVYMCLCDCEICEGVECCEGNLCNVETWQPEYNPDDRDDEDWEDPYTDFDSTDDYVEKIGESD